MKISFFAGFILLISLSFSGILEKAHRLFDAGDYQQSLLQYQKAFEVYPDKRSEIQYNIGLCYMNLDSTRRALTSLRKASTTQHSKVSALAYNQIGFIHTQSQKYPEALVAFRNALKQDSQNKTAAFNYELLLRLIEKENKKNPPKEKPSEKDQQDEQEDSADQNPSSDDPGNDDGDPSQDPDGEDGEEMDPKDIPDFDPKFSQRPSGDTGSNISGDTISLQKAKDILKAMRQNEMRFLQQLKRAPISSPTDTEKPKW